MRGRREGRVGADVSLARLNGRFAALFLESVGDVEDLVNGGVREWN